MLRLFMSCAFCANSCMIFEHSGQTVSIARLKANPATASTPVLAYLSHTQVDLKRAAEQAGCDLVLPRSVFSQNIHEILRRQSCHLANL